MFGRDFWRAAFIRALRTFLQGFLSVWGAGMLITEVNWQHGLAIGISMAVLSILTSMLTGLPEADLLAGSGNFDDDALTHEVYDPDDVEVE